MEVKEGGREESANRRRNSELDASVVAVSKSSSDERSNAEEQR